MPDLENFCVLSLAWNLSVNVAILLRMVCSATQIVQESRPVWHREEQTALEHCKRRRKAI